MSREEINERLPPILYKFRKWEKASHKTVLTKQEFYFSPVDDFIDENDCKFPVKFPSDAKTLRQMLDAGPEPDWLKVRYPFAKDRQRWKEEHIRLLQSANGAEHLKSMFYRETNDVLGVLSLTAEINNIDMWNSEDYAGQFSGFSVGFDPSVCHQVFESHLIMGGPCNYVPLDEEPLEYVSPFLDSDGNLEFASSVIVRKYKQFEFEKEYRLTKLFPYHLYPHGIKTADRLVQMPKNAFREVYIGYKMPANERQEIIDAIIAEGLTIPVFEASPDEEGGITKTRMN